MPEITRTQFAVYAVVVVAVVLIGSRALRASDAPQAPGAASGAGARAQASTVRVARAGGGGAMVHVAGAVRHPGVYRLPEGARVQDAVRRAGGRARAADLNAINLAARVADGQQVVVPRRAPGSPSGVAGAGAEGAGASPAAAGAGDTSAPVNLNTATAEQLDTLDGVGPATAQKILEYRAQHGGFRSVDDLGQIPGIGPKRLAALRARVQV